MTAGKVRRLGAAGVVLGCLIACLAMVVGQATADNTQTLTVAGVTVDEAAGTADFVVKLSAGPDDATFNYATGDGSAKAGSDYTSKSDTNVTVPGGGEVTISVAITNDDLFEGGRVLHAQYHEHRRKRFEHDRERTWQHHRQRPRSDGQRSAATATSVAEGTTAEVITVARGQVGRQTSPSSYVNANQSAADGRLYRSSVRRGVGIGRDGREVRSRRHTTQDTLDEDDETFTVNSASTVHAQQLDRDRRRSPTTTLRSRSEPSATRPLPRGTPGRSTRRSPSHSPQPAERP